MAVNVHGFTTEGEAGMFVKKASADYQPGIDGKVGMPSSLQRVQVDSTAARRPPNWDEQPEI